MRNEKSMKKNIKQFVSILLVAMLVVGMVAPVSAADNEPILLSLVCASDTKGESPVNAVSNGDTFYIVVKFFNCPTDSANNSVCAFGIYLSYDQEKMSMAADSVIGRGETFNPSIATNVAFNNCASVK